MTNQTNSAVEQTHNVNVEATQTLTMPRELKAALPANECSVKTVIEGRQTIQNILAGKDDRFLVVIGPCSIHDTKAAMEYANRLIQLKKKYEDKLYIVMRVYFEKPRTTVGWKGLINDPHLDGSFDMSEGLRRARKLLLDINCLGLPTGTEMLDPITPQYIDDLVSWASIGARTTESQTHRQMASGLSMPVGFKNATNGDIQVAVDAMGSSKSKHHFIGIDDDGATCIVITKGNPHGHLILRGGSNQPNYDHVSVANAAEKLKKAKLSPTILVDCSHANSGKKHENQQLVWNSIIEQKLTGSSPVIGGMIESNLNQGAQKLTENLEYGVSITDQCIGWGKTEQILRDAYLKLSAK
ncbi:Phospho-2-dehydro-3-deoxyheptonate aldolase, Tyr-sensitive [Poriferisphaera corsica]|uniref:Phospho-2-dehydro-3-deoxyheptonate aldolase n=1 Tax=Poriferisphaera corsica TaxID=2528020 RepID=A0A517YYP9_9BACT|nr:3-deoxy-7-phosphoheptulonate synthase [Poriferisphaera corsica]QDU35337.1 Phospho-2-dehydro-3-deoxyheptonate aldolase, Tyr-sensitive [Poriferisphaera corsica]